MVSVNNSALNELIACQKNKNDQIKVKREDLQKLRIVIPSHQDGAWIELDRINGLKYLYDGPAQTLAIQVNAKYLTAYSVEADVQYRQSLPPINQPINATILNYTLYNATSSASGIISGNTDMLYTSAEGNLFSNALYSYNYRGSAAENRFTRLESGWQYIDPVNIRNYILGDFISNATEWSNSLHLAGIQLSSAYTQRSDIITAALPQFSGSAALPSTLDLYSNQQRIYSTDVPSGPYDIKSLPYFTGNDVTLVVTDSNGRQLTTQAHYYYSPKILKTGLSEYSLDIGVPRYNYSTASNDYDRGVIFSAGSIRYGLSKTTTATSHIENSTDGLNNLGLGAASTLFDRGLINADVATSQYRNRQGHLSLIGYEGRLGLANYNFSYQKTYGDYYDIARVSQYRYSTSDSNLQTDTSVISPYANQIVRAGINFSLSSSYSLACNYSAVNYLNDSQRNLSLNLSGRLTSSSNFYVAIIRSLANDNDYSAYLSFLYTPKSDINITTSLNNSNGSNSIRQQFDKAQITESQPFSYGGHYTAADQNNYGGYANYDADKVFLTASYDKYQQDYLASASATGSVLFAEESLYFSHQIGNSFALIKNAGPGSHIVDGGVDLGETDRRGGFLIPDLTPYIEHNIYIDPTNMPLDWQPMVTEKQIINGYNQGTVVDFQAHKSISATLVVLDANQKPIGPGYVVQLNGQPPTVVGYGSEIYLTGIGEHNHVEIDLLDAGRCQFDFDYPKNPDLARKIGPYLCH